MPEKFPQYTNLPILLDSALTEREFNINAPIVHLFVPAGVAASVRFGSLGANSIPLQLGWQRFCFKDAPNKMYLTATKGDPMQVFVTPEIRADFFSEGLAGLEAVTWLRDVGFPPQVNTVNHGGLLGAVEYPSWDRNDIGLQRAYNGAKAGATAGVHWDQEQDFEGIVFTPTGAVASSMYVCENMLMRGPLSVRPGFELPGEYRVWHDTYIIRLDAAPTVQAHEINFIMVQGAVDPNFAGFAGNSKRWGIAYHVGIGGWIWFSADGAVITETLALSWPAAITTLVRVDFVHKMANANRAATVQLYLNGVLAVERDWEPGTGLPIYAPSEHHIRRCIWAQPEAVPKSLFVTGLRHRMGRLDWPSGAAIAG